MEQKNAVDLHCKSIFKSDSSQKRRENFTKKLAELINAQERAKQVYTTND